ncbi:SDR family NAD(P)-dependent oxidoreductase [Paenibacillus sp. 1-18]|uniref:SDR family NAD(P)-dependent oxidoreductase n=1 Tax=Paenibacillus sp. 1-18 TaxID=1333846 RepID=UPI00047150BF|nr:SDR family NAD(P)-dependent oxidoreductase [Paenibacillus sp. 1-18]
MSNKIALVTGANKGIGFEVARQLGRQGITVLVGARTKTKADEAASKLQVEGVRAIGVQLEVTNTEHVSNLVRFIEKEYGRLDILVNNAGRIVNQSSALGSIQLNLSNEHVQAVATPAYSTSKAALNLLTAYWSQKWKDTNLKINSAHPALVRTQIGGVNAELSEADGAITAVRLATLPDDGPTGEFYYMDTQCPW